MIVGIRLLSQAGIPKLRRITKERLKLKGKGHEVFDPTPGFISIFYLLYTISQLYLPPLPQYSDVTRLLTLYQLWLDDLYPRAKFADGLAIIEKLGHTKRMQTMRREWIRDGKPESKADNAPHPANAHSTANVSQASSNTVDRDLSSAPIGARVSGQPLGNGAAEESLFVSDHEADDQPPDDDLDALLAEDARARTAITTPMPISRRDEFEDEMEAMVGIW